jgi:DNA-binding CsgD family transcriptional regulator
MGDTRPEPLVLSDAERRTLQGWATRRKTAQELALRARIVLASAEGRSNTAVAARLGISRVTVIKWRAPGPGGGTGHLPRPRAHRHVPLGIVARRRLQAQGSSVEGQRPLNIVHEELEPHADRTHRAPFGTCTGARAPGLPAQLNDYQKDPGSRISNRLIQPQNIPLCTPPVAQSLDPGPDHIGGS